MRIETLNFSTINRGGILVKGIDDNGLVGLMKHNNRKEIQSSHEVKSKRATNINKSYSPLNHTFKSLNYKKIDEIKSIPHKKNTAGCFQMVFDFQDLQECESIKFYDKDYSKQKAKLIIAFLKEQKITEHFELIELINHNDEKNPHFHLTFNAYDNMKNKFAYNEFFSPIISNEPILDKDGKHIYKKHCRGKNKGKFQLDEDGNKILKTSPVRKSILQNLQNDFNKFLIKHKQPYRNKKQFTSLLQFSKKIWHSFDEELKYKIYTIRDKEKELNRLVLKGKKKEYKRLELKLSNMLSLVLKEANEVKKRYLNTPK